jgi:hypothetical protein
MYLIHIINSEVDISKMRGFNAEFDIPEEIDDHLKIFGNKDEFGYCACGGNLGVS